MMVLARLRAIAPVPPKKIKPPADLMALGDHRDHIRRLAIAKNGQMGNCFFAFRIQSNRRRPAKSLLSTSETCWKNLRTKGTFTLKAGGFLMTAAAILMEFPEAKEWKGVRIECAWALKLMGNISSS